MPSRPDGETHHSDRIGWLRAAVLGAQDGVASTASLLIGVAAASSDRTALIIAGVASLVAGALSMAAGEYTSVSSQRDTEQADIAKETEELEEYPAVELEELTQIYEQRGLDRPLARQVAIQLTKADALGSHVRDELGIHGSGSARPLQAAVVSASGFVLGAAPSRPARRTRPERRADRGHRRGGAGDARGDRRHRCAARRGTRRTRRDSASRSSGASPW